MTNRVKYRLTDHTMVGENKIILTRIEACEAFADVHIGDKGGFVQSESNLSHDGDAWIYNEARVSGNALVYGNARVFDKASVYEDARIYGDARVSGWANVHGSASVYDKAKVYDSARISGNARVFGESKVYGKAFIHSFAKIGGKAMVFDKTEIMGNARVFGNARIFDEAYIVGNAVVSCNAEISGQAEVSNGALILKKQDVQTIFQSGAFENTTTIYRTANGAMITSGWFIGTPDDFAKYVDEKSGDTEFTTEYRLLIAQAHYHAAQWIKEGISYAA